MTTSPTPPPGRAEQDEQASFSLDVEVADAVVTITVSGEVDLETRDDLTEALSIAQRAGTPVIVDMLGVTFCGSSGLNALIDHTSQLARADNPLILVATSRAVLRPIQLLEVGALLTIADSVPAARSMLTG